MPAMLMSIQVSVKLITPVVEGQARKVLKGQRVAGKDSSACLLGGALGNTPGGNSRGTQGYRFQTKLK